VWLQVLGHTPCSTAQASSPDAQQVEHACFILFQIQLSTALLWSLTAMLLLPCWLQVAQALLDRSLAPPLALMATQLLQLMTAAEELGASVRPEQLPLLQNVLHQSQQKSS
jgi:hypothetical protein